VEYEKVYQKFIACQPTNSLFNPVKVAILDTGIDRDHESIEARETNLKGKHNFHRESQRNVPDKNGHGTFAASLILDYAPDVELYVVKIADENTLPDAKVIVKVSSE
jgi:subtilisin family serine protease